MSYFNVCHIPFICETWLIRICDMLRMRRVTYVIGLCHKHEEDMPHSRMSHVTKINEFCHTCERSYHTREWDTRFFHNHVTRMKCSMRLGWRCGHTKKKRAEIEASENSILSVSDENVYARISGLLEQGVCEYVSVAVCCGVLQRVIVCCSVLQRVAVCGGQTKYARVSGIFEQRPETLGAWECASRDPSAWRFMMKSWDLIRRIRTQDSAASAGSSTALLRMHVQSAWCTHP